MVLDLGRVVVPDDKVMLWSDGVVDSDKDGGQMLDELCFYDVDSDFSEYSYVCLKI